MASTRLVCSLFVIVALVHSAAAQTTHNVGNSSGWAILSGGAAAYTNWSASQTFKVGDSLFFNFTTGEHDVATVTKTAFEACNATSPIAIVSTGPATITLTSEGEHYYICAFTGHCSAGQKLAVNVTGTTASSPSPSTTPTSPSPSATPPTASTSPPATTTPPSTTANSPTNTVPPPPTAGGETPSDSASVRTVAGFSAILLSAAAAALLL